MVPAVYLSTNMAFVIPTVKQLSEHKTSSNPKQTERAAMPLYGCCLARVIEGWNVKCIMTTGSRQQIGGISQMYKTREELSAEPGIYYDS